MKRTAGPFVSVIMPTFNPGPAIRRAVKSVFDQTYDFWELIIVDDASTENVDDIIKSLASGDKRVRSVRLDQNGGPARARNIGLASSTGEWIAVLDDDDAWLPTRLERLIGEAELGSVEMVFDNILGYDDHCQEVTGAIFSRIPASMTLFDVLAPSYEGIHNLGYVKPMIKRQFFTRNAIRYDERLRGGEDLLLIVELLARRIENRGVDEALYVYTTQVGLKSGRRSTKTRSLPRDTSIGEALLRFRRLNESLLNPSEQVVLEERAASFLESMPLAEFRHAKLTKRWAEATRLLFQHASVRRYAQQKLKERAKRVI